MATELPTVRLAAEKWMIPRGGPREGSQLSVQTRISSRSVDYHLVGSADTKLLYVYINARTRSDQDPTSFQ